MSMIDPIRRALGLFDSNGLRFSIQHLHSVSHRELLNKPLQQQSEYADAITVNAVDRGLDLKRIGIAAGQRRMFPLNTTAIGNAAYIILHANDPAARNYCSQLLNDYKRWLS